MPRSRVRSPRSKSRAVATTTQKEASFPDFSLGSRRPQTVHRFIGISLGGGKTDKTSMSVVEYYPAQRKIFLSRLFDKIGSEGEVSADSQVHSLVTQFPALDSVAFDVPLALPKCVTCRLKCPGFEACDQPEIEWMWKQFRAQKKKKSPPRLFTPYTERCVEQFLQTELEEPFHLQHALGSNLAPLTARAHFITRRLKVPVVEVFPKLSLWRIGNALHVPKSQLRFHRHWDAGAESRQLVLNKMMDKNVAFIYDQDVKILVESPQAFDSFVCSLTGLLSFLGHCEVRPKGFPKRESWLEIPKKIFVWP